MLMYGVPIYIFGICKHHITLLYSWFPTVKSLFTNRSFRQPVELGGGSSASAVVGTPRITYWEQDRMTPIGCLTSFGKHLSTDKRFRLQEWTRPRARFFSRKRSFKRSDLSKNRKKCHVWKTQLKRLMERSFDRYFYRGKIGWKIFL